MLAGDLRTGWTLLLLHCLLGSCVQLRHGLLLRRCQGLDPGLRIRHSLAKSKQVWLWGLGWS